MGLQHRAPQTVSFSTFDVFTQFSVHSCILKVWIQELVPTSYKILRIFEKFTFFVEKLLRFRALGQSGFESLWQPPANHGWSSCQGPCECYFWTTSESYLKKCARALILDRLAPTAPQERCARKTWCLREQAAPGGTAAPGPTNYYFFHIQCLRTVFRAVLHSESVD